MQRLVGIDPGLSQPRRGFFQRFLATVVLIFRIGLGSDLALHDKGAGRLGLPAENDLGQFGLQIDYAALAVFGCTIVAVRDFNRSSLCNLARSCSTRCGLGLFWRG